jgi:hypothetical protein
VILQNIISVEKIKIIMLFNLISAQLKAWEAGKFDSEIVPVAVPQRKGSYYYISETEI